MRELFGFFPRTVQMIAGFALGILIGFLSAVPFGLFVHSASKLVKDNEISKDRVSWITSALFAMPGLWFGGPWVESAMLTRLDWENSLEPYILGLVVAFVGCGAALVFAFIANVVKTMRN